MLESYVPNQANYIKISLEEQKRRGILGRLKGIIADFKKPTRNGRLYSEEVWDRVFADPLMKEQIESRCILGELGHPEDRVEIDLEKIALALSEPPKKGSDGKLYGIFDILDTPNGRILKTLCDYGCRIGISSRGSGDVNETYDGGEEVIPGTYDCKCWDAVLLPAVKEARLEYVTEALNIKKNNKTLKESLKKIVESASEDDKRVMMNCLSDNGISFDEDTDLDEEAFVQQAQGKVLTELDEEVDDGEKIVCDNCGKEVESEDDLYCRDDGIIPSADLNGDFWCADCVGKYGIEESINNSNDSKHAVENNEAVFEELRQAIKSKSDAETKLMSVQEKLSVSYAKEAKLQEIINNLKSTNSSLVESVKKAKALEQRAVKLEEKISTLQESVSQKDKQIKQLSEALRQDAVNKNKLQESISSNKKSIAALNEQLETANTQAAKLQEQLEESKQDLEVKKNEYIKKVEKNNKIVEHYKGIANKAITRYIDFQATRIGVSSNEIKNRLPESYGFDDIDKICEDMQSYQVNISKLPFSTLKEDIKIKATPSKKDEAMLPTNGFDDDVDSQLMRLAGL